MSVNNDATDRKQVDSPKIQEHTLMVQDRRDIAVRGVLDVLSFDESTVLLVTSCGNMALEGSELHVSVLDTKNGIVQVSGRICGVLYYDEVQSDVKKSRLGRFFK